MTPELLSSSSIRGTKVKNKQSESIGKIEDLMIDWKNGRISYAVLSFGGFLGIGSKLFAFPLESFEFNNSADSAEVVLNISKEALKEAPGFEKSEWPKYASNPDFTNRVYSYYNAKPYWA